MKIKIADSFFTRLKGLMFKKSMEDDEALVLLDTPRVHTSFMKFSIGIHYLDEKFDIIEYERLEPWKVGKKVKGARHIIETSERIRPDSDLVKEIIKELEAKYSG